MKVTIWIRSAGERGATLRLDAKPESYDTPAVQRFGRALIAAIERGANGETVEVEKEVGK